MEKPLVCSSCGKELLYSAGWCAFCGKTTSQAETKLQTDFTEQNQPQQTKEAPNHEPKTVEEEPEPPFLAEKIIPGTRTPTKEKGLATDIDRQSSMAIYCTQCGTSLPNNAVFCLRCGSRVQEEPIVPTH